MTSEQQEQLIDALDHLEQARSLFIELSENLVEGSDSSNPDDEPEEAGDLADTLENAAVAIEELIGDLDELRESF
ncbi:MAG: hypothetical protein Q4F72_09785 [Desulfovibrionaceae bacterium]|nr:hypothetical protein [Desulfovibrionaceae bacterium]